MEKISKIYDEWVTPGGRKIKEDIRSFFERSPARNLWSSQSTPIFRLTLVTGDRRGAGTDANVYVVVEGKNGQSKPLRPNRAFKDDHERGSTTHLEFGYEAEVLPPFTKIILWRDDALSISLPFGLNTFLFGGSDRTSDDWFLDRVEIAFLDNSKDIDHSNFILPWVFPVHRWIEEGFQYEIPLYDSVLPQNDLHRHFLRSAELERRKTQYKYARNVPGGPVQIQDLPADENFSEEFFWTFVKKRTALMAASNLLDWTIPDWKALEDIKDVFQLGLPLPDVADFWNEDWWFGLQRVQGVDSTLISLCTEIPPNISFPDNFYRLLEDKLVSDAVVSKRLFVCNLSILRHLQCKDNKKVASPIALFYLNDGGELLLPVLIQLEQTEGQQNVCFTPLDPASTWTVAKLFYNNAEAQRHQSNSHLGFTHLLMEGVMGAAQRTLATSHPLFRLMAPHFLYLIAINKRGEEKLINPGGWVDSTMTQGTHGMFELMQREFQTWTFEKLNPRLEISRRGVLNANVLPYYPYRDDALTLFDVIQKYVTTIVNRYYADSKAVCGDWELQNFRKELVANYPEGICLRGVPGSTMTPEVGTTIGISADGKGLCAVSEVIELVSCVISTCSLGHAATNAQQYAQYAFTPNYPGILSTNPPTTKMSYSECEIVSLLPSKAVTLDTAVITRLLSGAITQPLGHFEVQYLFHPDDVAAADVFRQDLKEISEKTRRRNCQRRRPYNDLVADEVPNSISI